MSKWRKYRDFMKSKAKNQKVELMDGKCNLLEIFPHQMDYLQGNYCVLLVKHVGKIGRGCTHVKILWRLQNQWKSNQIEGVVKKGYKPVENDGEWFLCKSLICCLIFLNASTGFFIVKVKEVSRFYIRFESKKKIELMK